MLSAVFGCIDAFAAGDAIADTVVAVVVSVLVVTGTTLDVGVGDTVGLVHPAARTVTSVARLNAIYFFT